MKLSRLHGRPDTAGGFSLIEMVGVLSIIATLASLLVPRLLDVIHQARVMETASSYHSVRSAAVTYAARFGLLGDTQGRAFDFASNPPSASHWDRQVLFPLGLAEQSFRSRIAEQVIVQVRPTAGAETAPDGSNSSYRLTATPLVANHTAGAGAVLDVRLVNVAREDAQELNRLIDGPAANLGESVPGTDLEGRVKYDFSAVGVTGFADVYLYLTHL